MTRHVYTIAIAGLTLLPACHRRGEKDFDRFEGGGPCAVDKRPPRYDGRQDGDAGAPSAGRSQTDPAIARAPWPDAAAAAGVTAPVGAGYCASDAVCGPGLVCDRALGACARPRGGCGTAGFQPIRTSGEVALVLDRSSSMRDRTATGTRWSDLIMSIDKVLVRRSEVAWGLALFPSSDAQACMTSALSVTPAPGTAPAISAAIRSAAPNGSGTPTRQAVLAAGSELIRSGRPTRKYLMLATDGEPNCGANAIDQRAADVEGAAAAVRSLAEQGVTTFVLGIAAGGEADTALARMAQAGGHARQGMTAYYTASDAAALESALDEVARQVALCTFDLLPPPPVGATLSLSIGGRAFARTTTHAGDGWDVTAGGHAIALYGAACDAVQSGAAIQVSYGCGSGTACDVAAMACVPAGPLP